MPPSPLSGFLMRLACNAVAALMVVDTGPPVLAPTRPPAALLPLLAQQVQRTAHLLHRHLWIFPPATAPCGRLRTSALVGTASDASADRHSSSPHNAQSQSQ